jgi:hypothetical protein
VSGAVVRKFPARPPVARRSAAPRRRYRTVRLGLCDYFAKCGLSRDAQLLAFNLIACRLARSVPGVVPIGRSGLAELLRSSGWDPEAVANALAECERAGQVLYDEAGPLMFIPVALEDDQPRNPNVLTSWSRDLSELPDVPLVAEIRRAIAGFLSGDLASAWEALCHDGSPNSSGNSSGNSCRNPTPTPTPTPTPLPQERAAAAALRVAEWNKLAHPFSRIDLKSLRPESIDAIVTFVDDARFEKLLIALQRSFWANPERRDVTHRPTLLQLVRKPSVVASLLEGEFEESRVERGTTVHNGGYEDIDVVMARANGISVDEWRARLAAEQRRDDESRVRH